MRITFKFNVFLNTKIGLKTAGQNQWLFDMPKKVLNLNFIPFRIGTKILI